LSETEISKLETLLAKLKLRRIEQQDLTGKLLTLVRSYLASFFEEKFCLSEKKITKLKQLYE